MGQTVEQQVHAAEGPVQAMLAIAKALDRIEKALDAQPASDGWGEWSSPPGEKKEEEGDGIVYTGEVLNGFRQGIMPDRTPDPSLKLTTNEDGEQVIDLPPPTDAELEDRRAFAKDILNLDVAWKDLPGNDAIEAYAVGGPLWLYHADRELMMNFSPDAKAKMINEIEQTHPREAGDIARDINKIEESDAPTLGG